MIEAGRSGAPTVLVVDDEPEILASLADLLRKEFQVFATTDANEALRLLGTRDVSLLMADQRMAGMSGTELLSRAANLSPTTVRVLITAYSDIEAVIAAINQSRVFSYLSKPWDPEGLLALVRTAVEMHALAADEHRLLTDLQRIGGGAAGPPDGVPIDETERLRRANAILKQSVAGLEEALEHLRRIQGTVPICMACGKIKTGEAHWEAVVEYLQKHTLMLSHGYCPECAQRVRAEWKLKPTR